MEFEDLDVVLEEVKNYLLEIIEQFRLFFFGIFEASDYKAYYRFFFLTIPIVFACLEALFDWLIPTFTGLQPMGIRRFVSIRAEALKVPEMKYYKPIRNSRFFIRFRPMRNNNYYSKLTSLELKHYQQLYQQKYNTTATPIELKKFVYAEMKKYSSNMYTYRDSDTRLSQVGLARAFENFKSGLAGAIISFANFVKKHKSAASDNIPQNMAGDNSGPISVYGHVEGRDNDEFYSSGGSPDVRSDTFD